MYRKIQRWLVALMLTFSIGGFVGVTAIAQPAVAASECDKSVLGFRPWYYNLTNDNCSIIAPNDIKAFIIQLISNIVSIGLMLVVYASIFYLLYGGFEFILSIGKPDDIAKAKKTLQDAIIGLLISGAAVAIVKYISGGF